MSRTTRTDRSASWKTIAGAAVSSARLLSTSWSLCRYLISRSKSSFFGALRGGADDRAALSELEALGRGLAQPVALLVVGSRRETPTPSPWGT